MTDTIGEKPAQTSLTATFERDKDGKGVKVITHPTGVVSRYGLADMLWRMSILMQDRSSIEQQIAELNADILAIGEVEKEKGG
jgi:hypothetical protein